MASPSSARSLFFLPMGFLIMASHLTLCARLPDPKEQDTAPPAVSGKVLPLHHEMKRSAVMMEKKIQIDHPMAGTLKQAEEVLRLAALLPAKSLQLLRAVAVPLIDTSIAVPATILEKASKLSFSDLHLQNDSSPLPPSNCTSIAEKANLTVYDRISTPIHTFLESSATKARNLMSALLTRKIKTLNYYLSHGSTVIQKNMTVGPQGFKKDLQIDSPTKTTSVHVSVGPNDLGTTPNPIQELTSPPNAILVSTTPPSAEMPTEATAVFVAPESVVPLGMAPTKAMLLPSGEANHLVDDVAENSIDSGP